MKKVRINTVWKANGGSTEMIDFPAFTIPASEIDQVRESIKLMLGINDKDIEILFYISDVPDLAETESPT